MALRYGECLLRLRRKEAGLSQIELSNRLKLLGLSSSPTLISQYEQGIKKMNPLVMKGCAKILNCTMEVIYEFPD